MKEWIKVLAPYVPVFQTFIWVMLLTVGVLFFKEQLLGVLNAIQKRIERGSSVKAGPLELGEDLKSLEHVHPASKESELTFSIDKSTGLNWVERRDGLYKESKGIFLSHVIEPSHTPGQLYDIFIFLVRHKSKDFQDVDFVEFFFGSYWGNKVFREGSKDGLIGVATSAYGPFLCLCRVTFKNGDRVFISRYIDFEMGRIFHQSKTDDDF